MNSKDKETPGIQPAQQLELLKLQCNKLAPNLYRSYALYLQILRSLILNSVRNSILSLIAGQEYSYSSSNIPEKSKACQVIVDKLVNRCNSLLTIEHILDLTRQMEREKKLIIDEARDQISSTFNKDKRINLESIDDEDLDESNIELGSLPPINDPSQIDDWFIPEGPIHNTNDIEYIELTDSQSNEKLNAEDKYTENSNKLDLFKSLFSIASQAFEQTHQLDSDAEDKRSSSEEVINNHSKEEGDEYLPDNPQALAEWINSFEMALSRRLRNLSHALNVELLRAGIINSIVPVGILDAVLAGQMSSQYSDSNILRICVPSGPSSLGDGIDIVCLLFRLSELEFENPKLRNCRSELRSYQKKISKMVRQQRHWQSRSLTDELQQNWWKNPPKS